LLWRKRHRSGTGHNIAMKRFAIALPVLLVCFLALWGYHASGQKLPTVSSDLAAHAAGAHTHRVIVQADDAALEQVQRAGTGLVHRRLLGALALEVNDAQLTALERNPLIAHISGDLPVTPHMAITNQVTAATSVWQGTSTLLGLIGTPGSTGSGVNVAVVDSGIAAHTALGTRVFLHVNLVSNEPGMTGDPFGHGTHIAGIIGGSTTAATNVTTAYAGGSAPSVKFVDVRVLGSNGSGLTSDVIAGIDWVTQNHTTYKIKVLNLSLGHPVTEPWASDPLCLAVERAVAAGVTTVVSAGNYGLTSTGAPVLGGITSPGNAPDALTVGAIDTKGTVSTSDDVVAPYSSKGPARYDILVKPDVVAPGTRIVSLEAQYSYLSVTYPQWHVAGTGKNMYMRLSGTSMATAVVSGGAALILSAYPGLSPAQIKLAMQMGARFMPNDGLVAAGAGSVNFANSMRLAQNGLLSNITLTVNQLLGSASGAGYRDRGTLIDRIYDRSGIRLLSLLDYLNLFQNADSAEYGVLQLLGLTNPLGSSAANYIVWGNVAGWSSSYYIVWGNTIQSPDGQYIVWGNNEPSDPNYIVWGNSVAGR
jgi:subtilisin family serine protease